MLVEDAEEAKRVLGLQLYRDLIEYLKRGAIWNRPQAQATLRDEAAM